MVVNVFHVRHSTIVLQWKQIQFIFDPFRLTDADIARLTANKKYRNYLLITHPHFDHLSLEDIRLLNEAGLTFDTVVYPRTIAEDISNAIVQGAHKIPVEMGEVLSLEDVRVKPVPAFNVDKINPQTNQPYHPKEAGWVGYVLDVEENTKISISAKYLAGSSQVVGARLYISGDTDCYDSLASEVGKVDVAFLPVSGGYVMTVEEAINCVKCLQPAVSIPIHYGVIVGTDRDASNFVEHLNRDVI